MNIMNKASKGIFSLALGACLTVPAFGQSTDLVDETLINTIRGYLQHPVVQISVKAQNRKYGQLGQSEINALDNQWITERGQSDQPLIAAALNSPASTYLTQIQAESLGLFTEIFITDQNGLNVGQSAITSDFWQGDEAKFQKSFGAGPDAVFVDEAEKHDDTNTVRVQVNLTIVEETNTPIGHATFEVNLTELLRRKGR
ncbi:hypothetical protein GCM10017044_28350 [Kordiimonas sediminis]|uniref:Uncharacterized protein n=1 Tax=Kordiimonas sediminis TaxID=1735581 RepID=A0A919EBE3_9PROT|nr:hypothetical protein [Kordiimonas sediminis]GHF31212.1 hypothetical protein GCM10017044_28350 [Kordiimonas sediminis]